jgi:histidinol dehydrogenase
MIRVQKVCEFLQTDRIVPMRNTKVEEEVAQILEKVASRGDEALLDLTQIFDGVRPELKVREEEIDRAYHSCDPLFLKSLEMAAENIRQFHRKQLYAGFEIKKEGILLGQRVLPLRRVGIYVPGGTASYPSTVLMNAIPAVLAGVEELVMVSPPDEKGRIPKEILAAAKVTGIKEIYRCGGAQAVGALAFGTDTIRAVDKIVGPGNIYVATAKKQVFGIVDIDMIAGPSEILVLADESANPAFVAADLLSQAEHDVLARSILICFSEEFSKSVVQEIQKQLPLLEREPIARKALQDRGAILLAKTLEEAILLCNELAPEHLELALENPEDVLPMIKNAGSVFLGHYTPEALGDYWAGPNHTLPTMGTARFASPLSVEDFVKRSSYMKYSKEALTDAAEHIERLAGHEGLGAHARSIDIRREK